MRPIGDGEEMDPWETYAIIPSITVMEPEHPEKSGLLDADGNPLIRERSAIGFLADL